MGKVEEWEKCEMVGKAVGRKEGRAGEGRKIGRVEQVRGDSL